MNVSAISGVSHVMDGAQGLGSLEKSTAPSFKSYLEDSISNVNELLNVADKQSQDMAVGKSENLHEAMISLEKADTALKLLVQVRNKALEALTRSCKCRCKQASGFRLQVSSFWEDPEEFRKS